MIRILGDVMLDRWVVGDVERISPDAPVPIIEEKEVTYNLGGAANVANNISRLGTSVKLYGSVGIDSESEIVCSLLENENIPFDFNEINKTTIKTRFVAKNGCHLLRWDNEEITYTNSENTLLDEVEEDDLIVISDYGKGIITPKTVSLFTKNNTVFVDPKMGPEYYRGAFLVKPNMKEFLSWVGSFNPGGTFEFINDFGWKWLVITDGSNGIHVFDGENKKYYHFVEEVEEIYDVTGAGDVVISILAENYYRGISIPDACKIACSVATHCVQKKGISIVEGCIK